MKYWSSLQTPPERESDTFDTGKKPLNQWSRFDPNFGVILLVALKNHVLFQQNVNVLLRVTRRYNSVLSLVSIVERQAQISFAIESNNTDSQGGGIKRCQGPMARLVVGLGICTHIGSLIHTAAVAQKYVHISPSGF